MHGIEISRRDRWPTQRKTRHSQFEMDFFLSPATRHSARRENTKHGSLCALGSRGNTFGRKYLVYHLKATIVPGNIARREPRASNCYPQRRCAHRLYALKSEQRPLGHHDISKSDLPRAPGGTCRVGVRLHCWCSTGHLQPSRLVEQIVWALFILSSAGNAARSPGFQQEAQQNTCNPANATKIPTRCPFYRYTARGCSTEKETERKF